MQDYLNALRAICQPVRAADFHWSLEPTRHLLAELGSPQRDFLTVVVAGSVGKGTACHQLASLLSLKGGKLRVGLYTGPHLHTFRERLIIDGQIISREAFTAGVNAIHTAAEKLPYRYSTFELATALALWWFAERGVSIAVLEVGIGGRWDAVNSVENVMALITPIEREHAAMLGGSLMTIAWHKAGIIRPGGQALSVEQPSVVEDVLREEAAQKGAALDFLGSDVIAGAACDNLLRRGLIAPRLNTQNEKQRIQAELLPARLEQITLDGRSILIDGGHTALAAKRLRGRIDETAGMDAPVRVIVGMFRDKAVRDYLSAFDEPRFHIIVTIAPGHRAFRPEALAAEAGLTAAQVKIVPDLGDALKSGGTEALTVICGSLRVAGLARELLGLLDGELLAEARATREIFEGMDYLRRLG